MPDKAEYRFTIADTIIDILKSAFAGSVFKTYYYRDPLAIPQQNLPCIIVETDSVEAKLEATGRDEMISRVVIKIVVNKKSDFGKSPTEVTWGRTLEQFACGIDIDTGEYHTKSVLGILRKNLTLNNEIENQGVNIKFGVTPRPGEMLTEEAHITVTASEALSVTGRR